MLTNDKLPLIREKALWMRRTAFTMVHRAQLGHPGGDFSAMDILATLYFGVLNYDPKRPDWADRDRFVMSKGHATGALYSALCAAGYFPEDWLPTYMQPKSLLNGHPNRNKVPGAIIGAVIGGILGHQVGDGRGRDLATVGGAIAGGAVGASVGGGGTPQEQDVQRCETPQAQARPELWDVSYVFRGQPHRIQMTTEPGATITVNRDGEPRI